MPRKTQSHGRIGEAAVSAKCWMHGIPAYNTGGLRSNFAGSDLIIETDDPRSKLWLQVKTGCPTVKGQIYLTQCAGEEDLQCEKFAADFVVFVNLDAKRAAKHEHDGSLDFEHLTYYIVPRVEANRIYREAAEREHIRPKRDGTARKLGNVALHAPPSEMERFRNGWHQLRRAADSLRSADPRS